MNSPPISDCQEDWTTIIKSKSSWFDLPVKELWQFRNLIKLFVWRDFVVQYKQTILGPLWHVLQPLFTTLIFTLVFGKIANLSTDGIPQFLFYMLGIVLWTYFSNCLTKTSDTFITHSVIFEKVYFPRLSIPISILISNLISFCVQFALFMVVLCMFYVKGVEVRINSCILITPLLMLLLAGLSLGCGIIITSLTTKYRDLRYLITFGVQLLMFATPVIYPVSLVPDKLKPFIMLNPVTPVMETFRYAILGAGTVDIRHLIYTALITIAVLFFGSLLFTKVERTFVDTV